MADEWIEYLKTIDSPTLSNAIELLNVRPRSEGFTPLSIRSMFPEFGRMAGYAVTAQVETMTRAEAAGRERFVDLFEAVAAGRRPAVVVMQEIGGFRDYSAHCGEVLATVFTRLGAAGLVSDCAVRDLNEVRALRFHYFSRGAVASHAYFRVVRVNVPVVVEGLPVRPGDLLHGDENGLILVPPGLTETLPAKVDEIRKREARLMDYVRGKDFHLPELRARFLE
jgi:regulator of RNase E activity RraA